MNETWTSPTGAPQPDRPGAPSPAAPQNSAPSPYDTRGPIRHPGPPSAPMTPAEARAADKAWRRAVVDARLPREPVEYQHVLRGPANRWWKPVLSLILLLLITVTALMSVSIVAAAALFASGSLSAGSAGALSDLDLNNPIVFALSMLSLAILIPISLLVIRLAHGVPAGYLHSVAGRFRWGWAGRLTLVLLPFYIAYVGLFALLSGMTWNPNASWAILLPIVLILVPLQSAGEEYAFRGVLMQTVGSWIPHRWISLVIPGAMSVVTFALVHGSLDPWILVDLGLFAALAVYVTWRTGGLEAAVVLHALNNVLLFGANVANGDMNMGVITEDAQGVPVHLLGSALYFTIVAVVVTVLAKRNDVQRVTTPPALPAGGPGYAAPGHAGPTVASAGQPADAGVPQGR